MLIRLQKYLADCGIASRRQAEELILAGKIKVNSQFIKKLGTKIDPKKDQVFYQNKIVKAKTLIYIMLNKPVGYTCTTRKFKNEKNIFDLVNTKEKLFPVGRLDKNSQGLIFLTNDGNWAYQLTHPKFEIEKEYLVKIQSKFEKKHLEQMKKGIKDDNDLLKIKSYQLKSLSSVNLILTQGHKREIRRLLKHFDYQITRLKRIRVQRYNLGNLIEGQWKKFQPK